MVTIKCTDNNVCIDGTESICSGMKTIVNEMTTIPELLLVLGAYPILDGYCYADVTRTLNIALEYLYLVGVIIKNNDHFRCIVLHNNERWILYDGCRRYVEVINADNGKIQIHREVQTRKIGLVGILY